jgi:hypothetical protein
VGPTNKPYQKGKFMKMLMLIWPLALLVLSSAAFAKEYGRRYKTSYSRFDTGFHRQYHYSESSSRCRTRTCMDSSFRSTDIVYVEEIVIHDRVYGDQRMVRVYDNDAYTTSVVTYYVYNDGPKSYVRGRRYNEHSHYYHTHYYYYTPYVMPGLALTTTMMDSFDEQSAALLQAGAIVFDFGLNVAIGCQSQECAETAGYIALAGVGSAVSASISNEVKKNQKSELENQIELVTKESADDVQ